MIDRITRDEVGRAIRDYMKNTITAFDLDAALQAVSCRTADETVKFVAKQMWFNYDDRKNHYIIASKQQWDFFNRLLLLLESEAEVEFVRVRTSWRDELHRFFHRQKPSAADLAITPYPSITSLATLRRSVKQFVRGRYPRHIAERRIRSIFVQYVMWIPGIVILLIFSPFALAIRMFRRSRLEPQIRIPQQ
ncbi:hypothetical protein SBA2_680039 [Acidobacteriia bacterium SbA2]|nr:hypothetical protein SBA2_680039 [Acidobacteriia bacterium SbA2]